MTIVTIRCSECGRRIGEVDAEGEQARWLSGGTVAEIGDLPDYVQASCPSGQEPHWNMIVLPRGELEALVEEARRSRPLQALARSLTLTEYMGRPESAVLERKR